MRADMEILPGKKSKIPIEKKYDQRIEEFNFSPLYAPLLLNNLGLYIGRRQGIKK